MIKGKLITEKLGYDISNFNEFKKEILDRTSINPSTFKSSAKYGDKYETRAVFRGNRVNLINVKIGWNIKDSETHMVTVYVNEVKKNEI